ncbi:MAG: hypothetical protein QM728_04065 [Gordonia sp. (in: high G+C Gram-positive bacteria)]|uniref:hypothetical protein n=1 Tax=Gordonia sp. (in: high G+C Gram-positive bacteria) TaxID=84139 RepID=UPI0039E3B8CC
MSYDHYILPVESCGDVDAAQAHTNEQFDLPGGAEPATSVAAKITARCPDTDEGSFLSIAPLEANGDSVFVPSPYSKIDEARAVVVEEAFAAGMGVYDPQNEMILDPRESRPGLIISSYDGEIPTITPRVVEHLVARLRVDNYLIVETGDNVYVQTKRLADNDFAVEYRDGSADRHFATNTPDAIVVAQIMLGWLDGGPAAIADHEWTKLDL